MRLTLIESDHNLFQTAECAFASVMLHAGLVCLALYVIGGERGIPLSGHDAAPMFLAPPDRQESPPGGQTEIFRAGQPGGYFADGSELDGAGSGSRIGGRPYGRISPRERSSAIGLVPLGPPDRLFDSTFTVLQVDEMVERRPESAAPVYPPRLSALGIEGRVQATFVVDATGRVDMTSVRVLESDDPEFSESVSTALAEMRFRPAKRGGRAVRQLVEQRFNFRIEPPGQVTRHVS
jgi:TonB family protein